jgi:hypothetical protein
MTTNHFNIPQFQGDLADYSLHGLDLPTDDYQWDPDIQASCSFGCSVGLYPPHGIFGLFRFTPGSPQNAPAQIAISLANPLLVTGHSSFRLDVWTCIGSQVCTSPWGLQRVTLRTKLDSGCGGTTDPVTVLNPSFEAVSLSEQGYVYSIPDWASVGTNGGTFRPSSAQIVSGAYDGSNVAFSAWSGSGDREPISQTLATNVLANTTYCLSAKIGQRLDHPFGSASLQLVAGGEVLASSSPILPPPGDWVNANATFTVPTAHARVGEPLEIRLVGTVTGNEQVLFDDVRLFSAPAPAAVPSMGPWGLGSVVALLLLAGATARHLDRSR